MRACGLVHSTFETVPLMVTFLFGSYSPLTEWWASTGAAMHSRPRPTASAAKWCLITFLQVGKSWTAGRGYAKTGSFAYSSSLLGGIGARPFEGVSNA